MLAPPLNPEPLQYTLYCVEAWLAFIAVSAASLSGPMIILRAGL